MAVGPGQQRGQLHAGRFHAGGLHATTLGPATVLTTTLVGATATATDGSSPGARRLRQSGTDGRRPAR